VDKGVFGEVPNNLGNNSTGVREQTPKLNNTTVESRAEMVTK